jgi:hypothetical protein
VLLDQEADGGLRSAHAAILFFCEWIAIHE